MFFSPVPITARCSRHALSLIALLLAGCAERAATVPVLFEIEHRFGPDTLSLGGEVRTPDGDSAQLTRLSYYLGEFRLRNRDGRWFESTRRGEPAGDYLLVDARLPESQRIEALQVIPGRYDLLEFRVGVDPLRNRGGAQTGALDPALGMFWTWNSGYIFFALEGRSTASGASDGSLTWHLGGSEQASRTVQLPIESGSLSVRADRAAALVLRADLRAFLRGIAFDRDHTVMGGDAAGRLADQYAPMFRVTPRS